MTSSSNCGASVLPAMTKRAWLLNLPQPLQAMGGTSWTPNSTPTSLRGVFSCALRFIMVQRMRTTLRRSWFPQRSASRPMWSGFQGHANHAWRSWPQRRRIAWLTCSRGGAQVNCRARWCASWPTMRTLGCMHHGTTSLFTMSHLISPSRRGSPPLKEFWTSIEWI